MTTQPESRLSLRQRLGWFALLWLAGIAAVGLVALLIRGVLL